MSVTIKPNKMKYKDSSGNYVGVNAIAERTTAEEVADIQAVSTTAQGEITALTTAKKTEITNLANTKKTEIDNKATEVTSQLANAAEVRNMLAGTFSTSTNYTKGQYVIQTVTVSGNSVNKLYRFTADHPAGNWLGTDVVEVKLADDVSSLSSAIDEKADAILKTIDTPASIITIEDGADDLPVKEMKVAIDPVQDLNGYDHPWPGGRGKNLGNVNTEAGTGLVRGLTATKNSDGSVTIKGMYTSQSSGMIGNSAADADLLIPAGSYILSGTPNDSYIGYGLRLNILKQDGTSVGYDGGSGLSFSFEEDTLITLRIHIDWGKAYNVQLPNNGVTFYPMIRKSTDSDEFAPYENICPITGRTGAKVTRTGGNLWDEVWETGYISNGGNNAEAEGFIRSKNYINVLPSTDYYFLIPGSYRVFYYKADKTFISYNGTYSSARALTTPSNCEYVRFYTNQSTYGNDISINYPSTDTQYHSGHVQQITYTFPSEAGTVYGGNLTIHADGTGELVVDRGMWTIDGTESNWEYTTASSGRRFRINVSNIPGMAGSGDADTVKSDKFIWANSSNATWGHVRLMSQYLNFTDNNSVFDGLASFKAWLSNNNTQVFAPLAEPVSYELTAPQVRTLLGLNHIWADAGDIESITYPVDTAIALDNQTATTQGIIAETDSTVATESHAVGDVFICNNKLYKAKDAIAVGENIIEGSNVIQTSVAELIVKGPQFVCNFGLSKNEYVELNMNGVCRAVAFVNGASAGRNGMIHAFSNASSVYAESAASFDNVSVSYNNTNRTVKIQNTGNDDIYVDVLKLYGDIEGTWVMPLGI